MSTEPQPSSSLLNTIFVKLSCWAIESNQCRVKQSTSTTKSTTILLDCRLFQIEWSIQVFEACKPKLPIDIKRMHYAGSFRMHQVHTPLSCHPFDRPVIFSLPNWKLNDSLVTADLVIAMAHWCLVEKRKNDLSEKWSPKKRYMPVLNTCVVLMFMKPDVGYVQCIMSKLLRNQSFLTWDTMHMSKLWRNRLFLLEYSRTTSSYFERALSYHLCSLNESMTCL